MDKELYPLSGVVAIPQTPFLDDDRIDLDSLIRAVDDRLRAGVSGILYPVVASEVSRLTDEERRTATAAVLDRVGASVPVIVGTSAEDSSAVRRHVEFAIERGASGVLVQIPARIIRDEAAVMRFVEQVCEAGIELLMIQDLEWDGPGLPVSTIARLFETIPAFRCIKVETTPAGPKYSAIIDATRGRLHVSGGWAVPQFIEALDRGIHAIMPGGLHWVLVEVDRRYRAGDRVGAMALFDRLIPILVWQNQHIDISNRFLKEFAVRQGIFRTARLRAPTVEFDAVHRRIGAELVEQAVRLHEDVGWRPA